VPNSRESRQISRDALIGIPFSLPETAFLPVLFVSNLLIKIEQVAPEALPI
jgi:hypothetical protein